MFACFVDLLGGEGFGSWSLFKFVKFECSIDLSGAGEMCVAVALSIQFKQKLNDQK